MSPKANETTLAFVGGPRDDAWPSEASPRDFMALVGIGVSDRATAPTSSSEDTTDVVDRTGGEAALGMHSCGESWPRKKV